MKTTMSIFVFALPFVLFSSVASAAPAQWGIAINHQTKECAAYWPGDEFHHYSLKAGWKEYFPDHADAGYGIVTEFGTCPFARGYEKVCCDQWGLTFVTVDWDETDGCHIDQGVHQTEYSFLSVFFGAGLMLFLFSVGRKRRSLH